MEQYWDKIIKNTLFISIIIKLKYQNVHKVVKYMYTENSPTVINS